jgi:hypothetical protein
MGFFNIRFDLERLKLFNQFERFFFLLDSNNYDNQAIFFVTSLNQIF